MKTTAVAIDFGSSKIVTLIAENSGAQRCDIVGAGVSAYDGYLSTGWTGKDEEINEAIKTSIADAEEQWGGKIRSVNIGVPGMFTHVYETSVKVPLKGTDPKVTSADVKEAFRLASKSLEDMPGAVIHSSPAWFMVDNSKKTLEPVGMKGREMVAYISYVVANRFFVDDINMRMSQMGYVVEGYYSTSVGESMLYISEQERDHTSVLIDIGYLNTEIIGVEGDAIIYHKMLDMGGADITVALADKLDIPMSAAEEIKRKFVYGIETESENFVIPGTEGEKGNTFTREQVKPVICEAADELAEEIRKALYEDFRGLGNWSSIFLTGGGLIMNRGGKEYLSGKLKKVVQETPRRTTKLHSHTFSSALGLLDLIIDTIERQHRPNSNTFGGKVKGFFSSLVGG